VLVIASVLPMASGRTEASDTTRLHSSRYLESGCGPRRLNNNLSGIVLIRDMCPLTLALSWDNSGPKVRLYLHLEDSSTSTTVVAPLSETLTQGGYYSTGPLHGSPISSTSTPNYAVQDITSPVALPQDSRQRRSWRLHIAGATARQRLFIPGIILLRPTAQYNCFFYG
jgi:hypothetical protein